MTARAVADFWLLWMDNSIRQSQPFGRHFALNGAIFLIRYRRHQFQTMCSVTGVFLVLVIFPKCHVISPPDSYGPTYRAPLR
jgi:hypothetical protein